jgi:hypothetical protein
MALYATLSRNIGLYKGLVVHDSKITETVPQTLPTGVKADALRAISIYTCDLLVVNVTVDVSYLFLKHQEEGLVEIVGSPSIHRSEVSFRLVQ